MAAAGSNDHNLVKDVGVSNNQHWRCTRCGSSFLQRSRTRIWERPLRLLSLHPYRCRDCGHRRYASIWWSRTTVQKQPRSLPENHVPAGLTHATEGEVRMGAGKKWMLVYGLLACLFIVAIASLKFGHALLNRPSLSAPQLSSLPPANQAHEESPALEAANVKSPPLAAAPERQTGQMPADTAGKADASLQSAEQRSPRSHQGDASGSAPAEAIRALRPKLPADIQSSITSDNVVEVRVRINQSGEVVDATAISARGPVAASLVRYSLDAARRWRFRPARDDGKPVRSDKVLEFLFRPSGS
jgi:DNA-directed RNA polymerase subunit RPC12/RpoP